MLYQLFGESLSFSDGHNGIIEYLLSARCNSFNINTWLSDVGSSILPLCGLFAHRDTAYWAQSINSAPVERMSWPGLHHWTGIGWPGGIPEADAGRAKTSLSVGKKL